MSIIKGTNQIVAGFGGTKRSIGEVYFSQSSLATDNSGALPLFTGETIASANTIYPDFYNWVLAHTELQCTSEEYENALSTYGECPKYVTKFPVTNTVTAYKYDYSGATGASNLSVWDFYYEENGELIPTTSKVFYFKKPINSEFSTGETKKLQAFYDPALTKPIVAHKQGTVETALKNIGALRQSLNGTYVLTLGYYVKDENIATTTLKDLWNGQNTYVYLPESYAYETVSSTVTTYETNGTIRLPKLSNYIKAANTSEGITQKEAGLPSITGAFNAGGVWTRYASGAFAVPTAEVGGGGPDGEGSNQTRYTFDASRSSSVYGKSSTVTPASTTLYPWVVAYTAAIPASTAQAAGFQQGLSGKADKDLSNVNKTLLISYGDPDFTARIANSAGTEYTAASSGLLIGKLGAGGNYGSATLTLDGLDFPLQSNGETWGSYQFPFCVPVGAGCVYKLTASCAVSAFYFVPFKGGI